MIDETDKVATTEPVAAAAPEPDLEPIPEAVPETSTHDRLRAFEHKVLGEDVERHEGKIEKGSGSRFASLKPEHKAHHAALHALIDAERAFNAAKQQFDDAAADLESAKARAEAASAASEGEA